MSRGSQVAVQEHKLVAVTEDKVTRETLRLDGWQAAFDAVPQRMVVCDKDLVICAANAAFREADAVDEADLVGRGLRDLIGDSIYEARLPHLRRALAGEVTTFVDWGLRSPRRDRMLRITYLPMRKGDGEVSGILVILDDTTQLHHLERRISMQQEVFNQTSDGLAVLGVDGRYVWANPAYSWRWRLSPDQVLGRTISEIVGTEYYLENVLVPFSRCLQGESFEFEDPTSDEDGSAKIYSIRLEPLRDADNKIMGVIINRRDITEAVMIRERLIKRDREDALTGLPNRHGFEAQLARRITPGSDRPGAGDVLLVVDIDDMRIITDIAGHAAGDGLLRHLASLLAGLLPDALLARVDADRFAMLVPDTGCLSAAVIAEHVVATVEATGFDWQGNRFAVGVSVGVVELDGELADGGAPTVFELLSRAEGACLVARNAGGSRYSVFHAEDRDIIARNQEVTHVRLIHEALLQDRFELYSMPIVPLGDTGEPYEEILLRVLDQSGQPLPPGAFIEAAERHGLMTRVDRWVVEAVLRRVPFLPEGSHLSVNLSGQSVGDPRFKDFLVEALDAAAPPPGVLSFEITETSAVHSFAAARDLIAALRQRGCGVILDDFGSGLSSFGYLRKFDVDMLKIDGSIIGGLLEDRVQQVIVAGIVAVAEAMSIRVVAEYVEDQATAELLHELGVSFGQGYGIGRPRPWEV